MSFTNPPERGTNLPGIREDEIIMGDIKPLNGNNDNLTLIKQN